MASKPLGDIQVKGYPSDDPWWMLHPVRDRSDRRRLKRTMADIVTETDAWWDHETGETAPVVVIWNE